MILQLSKKIYQRPCGISSELRSGIFLIIVYLICNYLINDRIRKIYVGTIHAESAEYLVRLDSRDNNCSQFKHFSIPFEKCLEYKHPVCRNSQMESLQNNVLTDSAGIGEMSIGLIPVNSSKICRNKVRRDSGDDNRTNPGGIRRNEVSERFPDKFYDSIKNIKFKKNILDLEKQMIVKSVYLKKRSKSSTEIVNLVWQYYKHRGKLDVNSIISKYGRENLVINYSIRQDPGDSNRPN